MALSSPLTLVAIFDVLCAVYGARVIEVEWTPRGVRPFSNTGNPLQVRLGDQLTLRCRENVSNLFIQRELIQYEMCNATLGMFDFSGFCLPGGSLQLTLSENSQLLDSSVNFVNNSAYYLTSYSDGDLVNANNASINSGGQCLDGLRMIIIIGEVTLPTVPATAPAGMVASTIPPSQRPVATGISVVGDGNDGDDNGGNNSDGDNLTILYTIIPAVAGSIIVVVTAVILTTLLIKVCYMKAKTTIHNDPLSHHESNQEKGILNYTLVPASDGSSPQHRLRMITTRASGTQPNHYVDSKRLPSQAPSSQHSDSYSSRSDSEVTVSQQIQTPGAHVIMKTTRYSHATELPVANSGRRPLRPAPQPPVATYQNVEESDLPIYSNSVVDRRCEDSRPSTFYPINAWRQ